MGRQFRAARIRQTVAKNLESLGPKHPRAIPPPWFDVLERIPPSEILTRPVPVQHQSPDTRLRKPKRTFMPQKIVYEEDELRRTFFKDHPWELARPRIIMELDGKDARYLDWSKGLLQSGFPLTGESVVQRQLWLMHNQPNITKAQAYDQVRREFYSIRQREEIEKRIAQEEARMVGGYFGKSRLDVGFELESREYGRWKSWALAETAKEETARSQAYTAFGEADTMADETITGTAEDEATVT